MGLGAGGEEVVALCAWAASDMNSRPDCRVTLLPSACREGGQVRGREGGSGRERGREGGREGGRGGGGGGKREEWSRLRRGREGEERERDGKIIRKTKYTYESISDGHILRTHL